MEKIVNQYLTDKTRPERFRRGKKLDTMELKDTNPLTLKTAIKLWM